MDHIARNIDEARARIAAAASRSGRAPDAVTLVAVTKTFPASVVRDVIRGGVVDIGENRVQELVTKAGEVASRAAGFDRTAAALRRARWSGSRT
jgi:uncharacterized pyridoxal phosphate-containing UPF0001 family protein